MTCKYCKELQDSDEYHEDRKCTFQGVVFNRNNWLCGAMVKLRKLALSSDTPYNSIHCTYTDDYWYATFKLDDIFDNDTHIVPITLYLQWYKRRGRTETAYLMFAEGGVPRTPTEKEIIKIVEHYS